MTIVRIDIEPETMNKGLLMTIDPENQNLDMNESHRTSMTIGIISAIDHIEVVIRAMDTRAAMVTNTVSPGLKLQGSSMYQN